MPEPTRSRKDVVAVEPVNEPRAEMYVRLMDAQERIAQARYERGVEHTVVLAALDGADEALSETNGAKIFISRPWRTLCEPSAANSRCGPCSGMRRSSFAASLTTRLGSEAGGRPPIRLDGALVIVSRWSRSTTCAPPPSEFMGWPIALPCSPSDAR